MTDLLLILLQFGVSLFFLVRGADSFTRAAEQIGVILGVSPFIIGITVVSVGTSLPELAANIAAVHAGAPGIVLGNVVGSNIANIFLVLGVTLLLQSFLHIEKNLIDIDLPLLGGATALLLLTAMDGTISLVESVALLAGYGVYLSYAMGDMRSLPEGAEGAQGPEGGAGDEAVASPSSLLRPLVMVLLSGVAIWLGAKYLIDSIVALGQQVGLSTAVISASAVAIGTSLPELFVCFFAVRSGNADMAIGNVIGSNIFNALMVTGLPGLMAPLPVDEKILTIGLPYLVAATVLLILANLEKGIYRFEGLFYLILYGLFIGSLYGGA